MNIKELAEQAGYLPDMFGIGHWDMPECKRFAELVAAAERELCAKLCEELDQVECATASRGATAIRARGDKHNG
jgi:hypothetical protein